MTGCKELTSGRCMEKESEGHSVNSRSLSRRRKQTYPHTNSATDEEHDETDHDGLERTWNCAPGVFGFTSDH
jgi:hypothetical protein